MALLILPPLPMAGVYNIIGDIDKPASAITEATVAEMTPGNWAVMIDFEGGGRVEIDVDAPMGARLGALYDSLRPEDHVTFAAISAAIWTIKRGNGKF